MYVCVCVCVCVFIYIYIYIYIMELDAALLNTKHNKVRIKVKWSNPGKGVAPSPTPWCCSYQKGSLRVTLNCSRQLNYCVLYTKLQISDRGGHNLNIFFKFYTASAI